MGYAWNPQTITINTGDSVQVSNAKLYPTQNYPPRYEIAEGMTSLYVGTITSYVCAL